MFRVIIMEFIDAHSFDVRSIKKTCVHIVHPDGRLIPFDTYNLFYRGDLERTRLAPLRAAAEKAALASNEEPARDTAGWAGRSSALLASIWRHPQPSPS